MLISNTSSFIGKATTSGSAVSEKVRTRLEELDDLEEVGKFLIQLHQSSSSEISFLIKIS